MLESVDQTPLVLAGTLDMHEPLSHRMRHGNDENSDENSANANYKFW